MVVKLIQIVTIVCLIVLCKFGSCHYATSLNILGIVTSPSKSHHHQAAAILDNLANSGHAVTVLSPHPQSPKINHYYLESIAELDKHDRFENPWQYQNEDRLSEILNLYGKGVDRMKAVLKDRSFQKLINTPDLTVDVILIDYDYNEALIGLGEFFKCPVTLLVSGELRGLAPRLTGLSYPFYNYLNFFSTHISHNLFTLLTNIFFKVSEQFFVDFVFYKQQKSLYDEVFANSDLSFDQAIEKSVAKVFISRLSTNSLLTAPDIVDVTGFHVPVIDFFDYSFSEELDNFVHSAEDGFIYVSLGADINPMWLPKDLINSIFRVIYRRPEKVIWAWNGNTSVFGTSNEFYLGKWLPQNDILRHPNVKLFITNGGYLSLIESIHHEVPVVGIPFTNEQSDALDFIESQGLGVKLSYTNISMNSLSWAISEAIDNERYRKKLATLSEELLDKPLPPLKVINFWLNHVHRHHRLMKGYRQESSLISYYLLDVYFVAFIILVTIFFVSIFISRCLLKLVTQILTREKMKMY